MKEILEKLTIEQLELEVKTNRLKKFLKSDKSKNIGTIQESLLDLQLSGMTTYLKALDYRIIDIKDKL